jgi:hypothetical protein
MKKNRDRWDLTEEGKKIAVAAMTKFTQEADAAAQARLDFK